jgi:hypothetical protein
MILRISKLNIQIWRDVILLLQVDQVVLAGRSRDPQGQGHMTHFARYLEFILDSNFL